MQQKDSFQRDTEVINDEAMWCLNSVFAHTSFRATPALASLFPLMFLSSTTTKKMELGKDKVGHTIGHGLTHFFRESLMLEVSQTSHLVVLFDK